MEPITISIQIFSDMSCPWCYVGKVILDRAMDTFRESHADVDFKLDWNPFYLFPFPEGKVSGYNRASIYAAKFGTDRARLIFNRVAKEANVLGLAPFTFAGRTGHTRDSHLLLLLAQRRHPQATFQALQTWLFRGAWERGRDISDRAFLLEAAREVLGEREADVLAWLDDEARRREVDEMDARAKGEAGVVAVPSYMVQGRYRVGGKQEEQVFLELFERIWRAQKGGEGQEHGDTTSSEDNEM